MMSTALRHSTLFLALALCLVNVPIAAGAEEERMVVAVTILPQKTMVEAVAGDLVDVIAMVPAGTSPGNYEPTPMEMESFSKAKIYFTIGVPTEKTNILPEAKDMEIVDLASIVAEQYPDRLFSSGSRDPHIWLSPKRAIVIDDEIATGGTMFEIVQAMADQGVTHFSLACTHGLFTGNAIDRLKALSCVDEIVCTDTVYAPHAIKGIPKLRIESVAPVIGEAIRCNHEGRSVGELFAFWTEDMPPESWFG